MTLLNEQSWHLLGWTMLHFLWLGAALLLVAAIIRRTLRRAGPNVRYAHSLVTLLALAALPLATAIWLDPLPPPAIASSSAGGFPPPSPPGEGEGTIPSGATGSASDLSTLEENTGIASGTLTPQFIELNPNYTPQPNSPAEPGADVVSGAWGRSAAEPPAHLAGGSPSARPQPPVSLLATLETLVPYLPYLWLVGTPITFALLATGLLGAERMRRHGTPLNDGPVHEACERLRRSLRITRRVALAVCDRVAQPVLVGIVRPLILLPPVALTGWSPAELEMVLLHELAHVRRWDNLINLAQRVIESLLFFHPAVWIASTWVRRDREECCDAIVVTRTQEPKQYAELLVSLATPQPLAGLALASHPLAARLRRILKLEDEPMLVSRNTIGLLLLVFAIAAGIGYGPIRAMGEAQPETPAASSSYETQPTDEPPADVPPNDSEPATQPLHSPPPGGERSGEGELRAPFPTADPPPSIDPLADLTYASPDDKKTALRAWYMLRLKLAPATDAELDIARKHGHRGGLKLIGWGSEATTILSHLHSIKIGSFSDLENALDEIARQNPEWVILGGRDGDRELVLRVRYWSTNPTNEAASPSVNDSPQPARYSRTYQLPDENTAELEKLEKWLRSSKQMGTAEASWGNDGILLFTGTKDEHERIAKLLTDVSPQLPFLSLEDQKIADRAYKLLGVELEPLTQEELARVAKLGFQGGLRVSFVESAERKKWMNLVQNDLLVGLHIWPITSFESLNAVLKRPDLAQLSPLKFYVVRNVREGAAEPTKNTVVTGRLAIDPDELRLMQNNPITYAAPPPGHPFYTNSRSPLPSSPPTSTANPYGPATVLGPRVEPPTARTLQAPPTVAPTDPALLLPPPGYHTPQPVLTLPPSDQSRDPDPPKVRSSAALPWTPPTEAPQPTPAQAPREQRRDDSTLPQISDWPTPTIAPTWDATPAQRTPQPKIAPPSTAAPVTSPHSAPPTLVKPVEPTRPATDDKAVTPQEAFQNWIRGRKPDASTSATTTERSSESAAEPVYRYDGKTFETWRDEWKHELSTEKRIEAVKALAAFARAGQAKEAAEAILEVAVNYDMRIDDEPEKSLKEAVQRAFTHGSPAAVPTSVWLPLLIERLQADRARWESLAQHVIYCTDSTDPAAKEKFLEFANDPESPLRLQAFISLVTSHPQLDDEQVIAALRKGLSTDDPALVGQLLKLLRERANLGTVSLDAIPEFYDALLDPSEEVRDQALSTLRGFRRTNADEWVKKLTEKIEKEPDRKSKLTAIRALGAFGPVAESALPQLESIVIESKDPELMAAAAYAIQRTQPRRGTLGMGLLNRASAELNIDHEELMNLFNAEVSRASQ